MFKNVPLGEGDDPSMIKMEFNQKYITKLSLKVRENSFVKKDQKIGEYYINDIKNNILSPLFGRILKVDLEEKFIVLEKCHHEKIYFNLCTECGFNVNK
jgi:hypothetical protein